MEPQLTKAEKAILNVLWQRGPCTVRQIHDSLRHKRASGYTTILKLLTIMIEKGLVARDESQRSHVYRPLVKEHRAERQLLREILADAFRGSPARLIMRALSEKMTDPEELASIRKRLDELERDLK